MINIVLDAIDTIPSTLWLKYPDGRFNPIIRQGTIIPTGITKIFGTHETKHVEFHVVQSSKEFQTPQEGFQDIGHFVVNSTKSFNQYSLFFGIDANGILKIGAKDRSQDTAIPLDIKEKTSWTAAELQKADFGLEPPKSPGYVYLIECGPFYKIGASKDPARRIKELGTLPPFDLKLAHTISSKSMYTLEGLLHYHFEQKRKNGEWFELDPQDVKLIKEL